MLCKESVDAKGFDVERQAASSLPPDQQTAKKIVLDAWLTKINGNCWLAATSGAVPSEVSDKIVEAYVIPSGTQKYGAILYEESNYGGKNQIIYKLEATPQGNGSTLVGVFSVSMKPSSIRVFLLSDKAPNSDWYTQLFEVESYNRAGTETAAKTQKYNSIESCIQLSGDFPIGSTTLGGNGGAAVGAVLPPHQFQSAKIEGPLLVIFFKDACASGWGPETELYVMARSDSNLNDNAPFKDWCGTASKPYPCSQGMIMLVGGLIGL